MERSSATMGALSVPIASVRVSAIFVALKILPFVAHVAIAHVEFGPIILLHLEVGTREELLNVRPAINAMSWRNQKEEEKDASQLQLLSSWKVKNQ